MAKVSSAAAMGDIYLEGVSKSNPLHQSKDNNKEKTLDSSIPIRMYQDYFDALVSDSAQEVENTLKSCTEAEELNILLNCPFKFEDDYSIGVFGKIRYRVSLPFHLAVGAGAKHAAEVMINYGVNILTKDSTNHNVLHSLVSMSMYYPTLEEKMCTMFQWLLSQTAKEHMVELLKGENDDGLRPLEYAAQQGTLQLVKAIFETKDIYVAREDIQGMIVHRWYDITEYETGRRKNKSPLRYIACLQQEKLTDPIVASIVLGPLFSVWIAAKIKQNWLPSLFWFLMRLSFMIAFSMFDIDTSYIQMLHPGNLTAYICADMVVNLSKEFRYSLTVILVAAAVALMIFDIVEVIRFKFSGYDKPAKYLLGKKQLIVNTTFYRICQSIMYCSVLICVPLLLTRSDNGANYVANLVIDITKVVIPIMCVWSIFYFIQLLPIVGSSIITIQGMISDMGHFIILYLIMILPFIHVFETFVNHNSNEGCIDDFSNVYKTTYTIFRIMLNMVDLTAFNIINIGILYSLHVVFIFLVAVMLINFLVAVMANSASNIAENRKLILTLNRLALVTTIEVRFNWCLGWYYKWIGRKIYYGHDGRVYLISNTNRGNQLLNLQPKETFSVDTL